MSQGDLPAPRPAKARTWEEAYLRYREEVLSQVRRLRAAQAEFLKGKIDSEEVVQSALDSFASECEARDPAGAGMDDLRGLLTCITFRKFCAQVDYWTADRRDARREVSAAQLSSSEGEGGGWQPPDLENVTPEESALLAEAWEEVKGTVEGLKDRFGQVLTDPKALEKARRIVDLLFERMHDPALQKAIREEVGCTDYFLADFVLPQVRGWLRELHPQAVQDIEQARARARQKSQEGPREKASAGKVGGASRP
jgi:hypothetical protein